MSHTEIAAPCLNLYINVLCCCLTESCCGIVTVAVTSFHPCPFAPCSESFSESSLKEAWSSIPLLHTHKHTHTHAETFLISALPSSIPLSLSLYSLLSAQNYKSQTGVHTHTILLLTHTHTLTAHALSGTDSQCCTGVRQRCVIERESLFSPRVSSRKAPLWRSFMSGWPQQRTFFIRPWKPRIGAKRKEEEFFCLFVFLNKTKHLFGWSGN